MGVVQLCMNEGNSTIQRTTIVQVGTNYQQPWSKPVQDKGVQCWYGTMAEQSGGTAVGVRVQWWVGVWHRTSTTTGRLRTSNHEEFTSLREGSGGAAGGGGGRGGWAGSGRDKATVAVGGVMRVPLALVHVATPCPQVVWSWGNSGGCCTMGPWRGTNRSHGKVPARPSMVSSQLNQTKNRRIVMCKERQQVRIATGKEGCARQRRRQAGRQASIKRRSPWQVQQRLRCYVTNRAVQAVRAWCAVRYR